MSAEILVCYDFNILNQDVDILRAIIEYLYTRQNEVLEETVDQLVMDDNNGELNDEDTFILSNIIYGAIPSVARFIYPYLLPYLKLNYGIRAAYFIDDASCMVIIHMDKLRYPVCTNTELGDYDVPF
jgi:hypothetical protein